MEGSARTRALLAFWTAIGRVSPRPEIRHVDARRRRLAAAFSLIGARARGEARGRTLLRVAKSMLVSPNAAGGNPLFDKAHVAERLSYPPETPGSRLFAAWLQAGARFATVPDFAGAQKEGESEAEAFERFVLRYALFDPARDDIAELGRIGAALLPTVPATVIRALRPEFDAAYYLERYPDVAAAGLDPVEHYVTYGTEEGRDPSPDFSTRYYLESNPDVRAAGVNPFYHYVVTGREEGRATARMRKGDPLFEAVCARLGVDAEEARVSVNARRADISHRLAEGTLGRMVERAGRLEPLIHHPPHEGLVPRIPPFVDGALQLSSAILSLHDMAGKRCARDVIVIPHVRMSGAARVAGDLAHALSELHGADGVAVVRTERDDLDYPEWFPESCRMIDFATASRGLAPPHRKLLLFTFLRSLGAERIFNVNSRLYWDMAPQYGPALASSCRTYAYMFCSDRTVAGHEAGYPVEFFSRTFDDFAGVITDSTHLADTLRERFRVPPSAAGKLTTLATPLRDPPAPAVAPPQRAERRPQVFWAGRFDRQKRVDVVFELARRMPDIDFRVWGKAVLDAPLDTADLPANVALQGLYDAFSDLPLGECDVWLYTAAWDGVPTILLDVAAAGVPLVGSLAGGTGEVLHEGLAERIDDIDDIDGFERALRAALADPAAARARAAELRERVLGARAPERYKSALAGYLASTEAA